MVSFFPRSFPDKVKKVVHPLVTCFILTDAAIIIRGLIYGVDWATSLGSFLTRGVGGTLGAGDLLLQFLGYGCPLVYKSGPEIRAVWLDLSPQIP